MLYLSVVVGQEGFRKSVLSKQASTLFYIYGFLQYKICSYVASFLVRHIAIVHRVVVLRCFSIMCNVVVSKCLDGTGGIEEISAIQTGGQAA